MPRFNPFSKAKRGDDPKGSADAGAAEPDAGARREVKLHKRLRRAAEGCAPQAARDALSGLRRRDKREKHTVERADFVAALQELLPKLGEEQVGEVATAFADADGKRVLYVDAFRQLFGPDVLDTEAPAASPLDRLDAEAQAELRGVAESAVPALRGALEGHDVATRGEIRAKRFIEEVQAATRRRIRSQDAEVRPAAASRSVPTLTPLPLPRRLLPRFQAVGPKAQTTMHS